MTRMMRHETLVLVVRHERLLARSTCIMLGVLLPLLLLLGEKLFLVLFVEELRLCLLALVSDSSALRREIKVELRRRLGRSKRQCLAPVWSC
jgi:hypothetical protein